MATTIYRPECSWSKECSEAEQIAATLDHVGAAYGEEGRVILDGRLTTEERAYVEQTFGKLADLSKLADYFSRAKQLFYSKMGPTLQRGRERKQRHERERGMLNERVQEALDLLWRRSRVGHGFDEKRMDPAEFQRLVAFREVLDFLVRNDDLSLASAIVSDLRSHCFESDEDPFKLSRANEGLLMQRVRQTPMFDPKEYQLYDLLEDPEHRRILLKKLYPTSSTTIDQLKIYEYRGLHQVSLLLMLAMEKYGAIRTQADLQRWGGRLPRFIRGIRERLLPIWFQGGSFQVPTILKPIGRRWGV